MNRKKLIAVLAAVSVLLLGYLVLAVYVFPKAPAPAEEASETSMQIPEYTGEAYTVMNGGKVYFTETSAPGTIVLSDLDTLGRCQEAFACIGTETLTYEDREPIGQLRPSGWQTARYDDLIEDHYLYNRCHLLGYALTGIGTDERNLITGTRYMNITGMLEFEVQTARYVQKTGSHVEYHVKPVFAGDELVCRGVLMQAKSVEDNGKGLEFCVFCHNVQPGVVIHYTDGTSEREAAPSRSIPQPELHYVINTRSGKFHYEDCDGVKTMSESNREDVWCTREELIERGYTPCGTCDP